jgi:hypothetical protein
MSYAYGAVVRENKKQKTKIGTVRRLYRPTVPTAEA